MDIAPLIRLLFSRVGQPSAGGSMAYSFNHPAGDVSYLYWDWEGLSVN